MTNWLGQSFTLQIERVAHGGHFVAHHEGRVLFVADALPGEEVIAEVIEDKGQRFCFARVKQVLQSSEYRIPQVWEAVARGAGGAEFGHIALAYQRELKTSVLRESLERFAAVKSDVRVTGVSGDDDSGGLNYRTRLQLHAKSGKVGVMRPRSSDLVEIDDHPLAARRLVSSSLFTHPPLANGRFSLLVDSVDEIHWSSAGASSKSRVIQKVHGREFQLSPESFWQSHRGAPELLYGWVRDAGARLVAEFGVRRILELYAGAGLFTSALLEAADDKIERLISVERSQRAVEDASLSLGVDLRVEHWVGDVLDFLRSGPKSAELVFLDPPRSGASGKVTELICRMGPRVILYLACDPVALARDTQTIIKHGYQLRGLAAADLFPHTHHFETLAEFVTSS